MYAWKQLGFSTYPDYLKSDLWRSIRDRVFKSKGRKCLRCSERKAVAVHHERYDRPTMEGETLLYLVPICEECHAKEHGRAVATTTRLPKKKQARKKRKKCQKPQPKRHQKVRPATRCRICAVMRDAEKVQKIDGLDICKACLGTVRDLVRQADNEAMKQRRESAIVGPSQITKARESLPSSPLKGRVPGRSAA